MNRKRSILTEKTNQKYFKVLLVKVTFWTVVINSDSKQRIFFTQQWYEDNKTEKENQRFHRVKSSRVLTMKVSFTQILNLLPSITHVIKIFTGARCSLIGL